jgi:Raf kinase inhibitor-like YbhB/YbcL family protein
MLANPLGVLLRNRRAGHHTLAWSQPGLAAPESFTLTSPAFAPGKPIPARHRGHLRGPNISPALAWTPPPAETKELVLIIQDPDVPMRRPATHALTIGIDPARISIPENGLAQPSPIHGLKHGKGALGRLGYSGPLPLRSHGPHSYVFQLYALDHVVSLPDAFTLEQVLDAIAGHVIARARLDGTYEIHRRRQRVQGPTRSGRPDRRMMDPCPPLTVPAFG